jgi:ATPase family associated with various cellular activities (AAA)
LHYDIVSGRDPQQLAWAVCGVIAARDSSLAERTDDTAELVRAGLRAFFEQQRDDGTWDLGRPLFHYPEAGNAYCYVFETLAELLSQSFDPVHPAAEELRAELRPYLGNLLLAKDHLVRTARALAPGLRGWSSGHHPHRRDPESWATGTAYRFLQLLRRLVGVETRMRALKELGSTSPRESLATLRERGRTWNAGNGAAGDLVAALFIHPTMALDERSAVIDPDRTLFDETRARSAILFGPPGTGKSTLAESVAGALGWDFVEITPADFLDQGIGLVSSRADQIFRQLMELDHCVVLLDEIDELIRSRTSSADPLERFFTTTMLPRLARLWKTGRVIFFVNTNSVSDVDPAVRRSQRFDAAIFVMPPSLESKVAMLPPGVQPLVDHAVLETVLRDYDMKSDVVSGEDAKLGWLAFLRHDQMLRLAETASDDRHTFLKQIARFGQELLSSDWALSVEYTVQAETTPGETLNDLQRLVRAFKSEAGFQRLDSGRIRIVRRAGASSTLPPALSESDIEGYVRWDDSTPDWALVPLNGAGEFFGS